MNQKERLSILENAYVSKKVDDAREQIYIINEKLPKETGDAIREIQFKLNEETGNFELDYDIMNDATIILSEIELEELETSDLYELASDVASVYTPVRLSFINNNNEQEITDLVNEYETDIETACAIWYDNQVRTACELLRTWVLDGEEVEN